MAHTLRKVDKDFTFDEQRVEINELAVDVYNLKHNLDDITLNDIEDVNVGAKSSWVPGNIIKWDGTEWTTDIDVSGITLSVVYDPLTYDPVTEKRGNIAYNGTTGVFTYTPPELNFLTELGSIGGHTDVDVTTTAPANGNVLKWDSSLNGGLGSWKPDTDSVGVTYSVQALASPGIQLLNDNIAQTSNRIFFDAGTGITLTRTVAPDASGGGTIKFEAATFTGTTVGFVPASTLAETGKYLKSDGSWDNPPNTEYLEFAGEAAGLVPASTAGVSNKFLRSDGSWQPIDADSDTTYSQSAVVDSAGVKLRLTDSATTPVNDDIVITAGTNITIDQITDAGFRINSTASGGGTADGNDYVTDVALGTGVNAKRLTLSFGDTSLNQDVDLSSIDTNTEYELKAIDSSDDIILKLDADASGTDDQVKIVAGNNITLTHTSEGEFKIDATGGAGGGANVTISTTAPTTPTVGDLWWHSEEGQLKIYYDDNDGNPDTQWVDTGGGGGNAGTGATAFTTLSDTPGDYTGQELKFIRVNDTGDALEFAPGSATNLGIERSGTLFKVTCNTGTDASLPLADTDNWGLMSDEMFDKLDGIDFSTSLTVGAGSGSSTAAGVTLSDGLVSIRTGTGSVAAIDLYCESTNAHKISIKAPAHANFSGNQTFVLPGSSGGDGDVLITDGNGNTSWTTSNITVKDDTSGVNLGAATIFNFVGAGVSATGTGEEKTITIPGGIQVQNDGTQLSTTCFQLNFKGDGVTASGTDATKEINIPGYDNTDVDAHLNKSTANPNEVLSWNGTDYDWVAQSGGGSSATNTYVTYLNGTPRWSEKTAANSYNESISYQTASTTGPGGIDLTPLCDGDNNTYTNMGCGHADQSILWLSQSQLTDVIKITVGYDGDGWLGMGGVSNNPANLNKVSGGTYGANGLTGSPTEIVLWDSSSPAFSGQLEYLNFTEYSDANGTSPGGAIKGASSRCHVYYFKITRSTDNVLTEITYAPTSTDGNGIVTANVKDFGAKGDDSTDDTTAIQNAINTLLGGTVGKGGIVYLPPGVYRTSSALTFPNNAYSIALKGSSTHMPLGSFGGSVIRSTSETGNAIEINNSSSVAITNLSIDHVGNSSGVAIKATSATTPGDRQGVTVDQVLILDHSKGIELIGYANSVIKNSEIRDQPNNANSTHAILLKKGADNRQDQIRLENVIVEGVLPNDQPHNYSVGLKVEDWTNSIWVKDCAFLRMTNGIEYDQSVGGRIATAGAFHRIENTDVDHCRSNGMYFEGGYAIWVQNCYIGSNGYPSGSVSASGLVTGPNFKGTLWVNNADCRGNSLYGLAFNVNHTKIHINSCHVGDNGTAQPSVSAGIYALNGANDISIIGGQCGGDNYGHHTNSSNQQNGIRFDGDNHSRIIIHGVDVTCNISTGIVWNNTSGNNVNSGTNFIESCPGYSPAQSPFP